MLGFSNKECENELNNLGFNQEDIELALFETDTVQGRAVMFSTNETLIRLRNKPKNEVQFGELQHGIFHCVTFIMSRIGMTLEIGVSDESYAYLTAYLTTEIYKRLK